MESTGSRRTCISVLVESSTGGTSSSSEDQNFALQCTVLVLEDGVTVSTLPVVKGSVLY